MVSSHHALGALIRSRQWTFSQKWVGTIKVLNTSPFVTAHTNRKSVDCENVYPPQLHRCMAASKIFSSKKRRKQTKVKRKTCYRMTQNTNIMLNLTRIVLPEGPLTSRQKCLSGQTISPRLTHNAEATGKHLASPLADWSPRRDVTAVKHFHVTSWDAP